MLNHAGGIEDLINIADQKLFENRTLFISEGINSNVAKRVVNTLLALDYDQPGEKIKLFLNSPGGEVNSGFAIYDTIRFLKSEVTVINTGLCASIATIINIAVPKERRLSMPNAQFLIHQPLIGGRIQGQASDIEITANEMVKIRHKLNSLLAEACGQKMEKLEKDTNRDYWMTAQESLEYGLIGKVIDNVKDI